MAHICVGKDFLYLVSETQLNVWIEVVSVQFHDFTKKSMNCTSKWVNSMVGKFHLCKAVKFKRNPKYQVTRKGFCF